MQRSTHMNGDAQSHRANRTGVTFSRRTLLRGLLGASAAIPLSTLLAACGDSDPTATPQPAATPAVSASPTTGVTPTSGSDADAFPVSIAHKFGSTTIERRPERIVAVGLVEQDAFLAMGAVPVATREWYGGRPGAIFPWAEEYVGSAPLPEVLEYELDFERIATLQPDLIIGLYSGLTQEEYDTLSRIAPTVAQPAEFVDWGIPWQELTLRVGQVLGQQQQAEALIADIEQQFVAARSAHPEFAGARGVVASPYGLPENYWVYSSQDVRGRIMTSLGFEVPEVFDDLAGEAFGATVSVEQLNLIADLDVLVWVSDADAFTGLTVYNSLPVVQENRVLYYGEDNPVYDALNFGTVLSLPFAIERFVPELAAALDGQAGSGNASDSGPRTIVHKFGTTEISGTPERVITIGFSEQDPVLALGVVPVAVREWFGDQPHAVWPWGQDALGDGEPTVLTMPFGELDFEAIAALEPDLIVATHSGITDVEYTTLAQIAPTLAQSADYPDFGMPWQEQTRSIGRALGREQRAETLVVDVETAIEAAAVAHPQFADATIAWASPDGQGGYWAVGPTTPPMRFLGDLGFVMADDLAAAIGDLDSLQVSSEQLPLLDADVLILQVDSVESRATLERDPLYAGLRAAREGRTIFFTGLADPVYGALSFSTVLSLQFAIDNLVPRLDAAVDGDVATEANP